MHTGINDSLRFTYCGLGKRIKKIHGSSDTTRYTYDGMYVVCEFGNSDSLLSTYVYANGLLFARYDSSGVRYYYHHDALGSTMGLTDTTKWVRQSYFYDDFGNLRGEWGNVDNHYLYTGQEYDDEISGAELYNLRARYYSPGIGRFISEDPVGFNIESPQMLNCYLYVRNNPLKYIDPTGRQEEECCYIIVIDCDELWRCIQEWSWSTEPSGIEYCVILCVACIKGIVPACVPCGACASYYGGPILYCIGSAIETELVPGPCPPSPPLPTHRLHSLEAH